MARRMSIVVAHRLSTILAADFIVVMDRVKTVERGTPVNYSHSTGDMLNCTKRNLNGKEFDPSRAFPKAEEHF